MLSAESAAEPGRWKTLPYQRGIMDAITDPAVVEVSVKKSARVGYTLSCIQAPIAFFIAQDPCSMMVVQPTVDDGKEFSKESIAPMFRDVPALAKIRTRDVEERGAKDSSNTLTHKAFPGGILSIIGANSGTGFRRKSRRIVFFDEVDAYPPSAGNEGDPIRLGKMRTQAFWNRKIIAGSTPLVAGASRITEMYEAGDQRRFYVPCPHCGAMDFLTFREQPADGGEPRGHFMKWDEGKPETAYFVCRAGGCIIEHKDKRSMIERGEWRAAKPFTGHASFHLWAAYSYAPNATWADIAKEFVEALAAGPEKLRTFVNTWLGETWVEKGEAPEWRRLYDRREPYERATVPEGVLWLTAGIDVQRDRLVYEVVGWGEDRQSWSIDAGIIPGDPARDETWEKADAFIASTYPGPGGQLFPIHQVGVDSGFETQAVYNWARRWVGRVIACKGSATAKVLLGTPTAVDVNYRGKRIARGVKVWPVGVDQIKSELYGWLRLEPPTKESGAPFPPGFCHFPEAGEYGEAFFKQLTAEHLVKQVTRKGFITMEWQIIPGRENHYLDARVYARAATGPLRLDARAAAARARPAAPPPAPAEAEHQEAARPLMTPPAPQGVPPRAGSFWGARPRGGWMRRR